MTQLFYSSLLHYIVFYIKCKATKIHSSNKYLLLTDIIVRAMKGTAIDMDKICIDEERSTVLYRGVTVRTRWRRWLNSSGIGESGSINERVERSAAVSGSVCLSVCLYVTMYKGGSYILWRASRAAPPQPRLAVSVAWPWGGEYQFNWTTMAGPSRHGWTAEPGQPGSPNRWWYNRWRRQLCSSESLVWDITRVLLGLL